MLIANYAGPAERSNVSLPLAALNRTARVAGRVHYAERVGGDALEVLANPNANPNPNSNPKPEP